MIQVSLPREKKATFCVYFLVVILIVSVTVHSLNVVETVTLFYENMLAIHTSFIPSLLTCNTIPN